MAAPFFKYKDVLLASECAVFSSNYALYGDMSNRVMSTLAELCDDLEIYSVDEAFLTLDGISSDRIREYALRIKHIVYKHTGIPVSVGIGRTKTEAKLANHLAKKDSKSGRHLYAGVYTLPSLESDTIYQNTPVEELWGIGRQYKKKLNSFHIHSISDLLAKDNSWIKKHLSIDGLRLVQELRGKRCYSLETQPSKKKSIASTRSFGVPVSSKTELKQAVAMYCSRIGEKLRKQGLASSYLQVFTMTNRFKPGAYFKAQGIPLTHQSNYTPTLIKHAHEALDTIFKSGLSYKKAGVIATGLVSEHGIQDNLFIQNPESKKHASASKTMDQLNTKYGRHRVRSAGFGYNKRWHMNSDYRGRRYTTVWSEMLQIP